MLYTRPCLGIFALALSMATAVLAHPGADVWAELEAREEHLNDPERRTMSSCSSSLEKRGHYADELSRRMERINALRLERGLDASVGPLETRQARANCILDPEVTEGPYWVEGHLIRPDVREEEDGVVLHLDVNVIDVTTCQPIPDIYVELWGCNSTGVYTGVVARGNGAGAAAPEEINNSALRGLQQTNKNGTASFVTVIPGHYVGRTNHLHTIVHHGATRLANNTIQGGTISHVGQFYFDQSLLQTVEETAPYSTNKQAWTKNNVDFLLRQGQANQDNPIMQITMLGASVSDGLHGVIDVGVNPTARRTPTPVNKWTASGGVPAPGSKWGGPPAVRRMLERIRR